MWFPVGVGEVGVLHLHELEVGQVTPGVGAGVLIRATGTRWPLPEINWPSVRRVESAVLIDFADEFHPKAAQNAVAGSNGLAFEGGALPGVCVGCHLAHRQRMPDGTYEVK